MKYDTSVVMKKAWRIYHHYNRPDGHPYGKSDMSFSTALHRAWNSVKARPLNDMKVEATKLLLGIDEECKTWKDWHDAGYEVEHGSKALFKVDLIRKSKGEGCSYKASFFGRSQVRKILEAG